MLSQATTRAIYFGGSRWNFARWKRVLTCGSVCQLESAGQPQSSSLPLVENNDDWLRRILGVCESRMATVAAEGFSIALIDLVNAKLETSNFALVHQISTSLKNFDARNTYLSSSPKIVLQIPQCLRSFTPEFLWCGVDMVLVDPLKSRGLLGRVIARAPKINAPRHRWLKDVLKNAQPL